MSDKLSILLIMTHFSPSGVQYVLLMRYNNVHHHTILVSGGYSIGACHIL